MILIYCIQVSLYCAARGLPSEVHPLEKALRAQFSLAQISQLAKALRAALDLRSAELTIFSD